MKTAVAPSGAGSLDIDGHGLDYMAQSRWHHFHFRLGAMDGLDRSRQEVYAAPAIDGDGREIIPRRTFQYDSLVICVGSISNDFGTPGVRESALSLDTTKQACRFRKRLIDPGIQANTPR